MEHFIPIRILQEIHETLVRDGYVAGFPVFISKKDMCLDGYDEQESELDSFENEWVSQSCGMGGDDHSGDMVYLYGNTFIKVSFC